MIEKKLNESSLSQVIGGSIVGNFIGDWLYWGTRGMYGKARVQNRIYFPKKHR
ncbi:hypothetical protein [Levilactobacillus namurensis]|uniref:hypothetical protein n=1 Tax=Levilactobacillus namurensis TaxID=380393 RepID=UPI00130D628C|nr:hypothetical protein [Levilactobacillus namurensis]